MVLDIETFFLTEQPYLQLRPLALGRCWELVTHSRARRKPLTRTASSARNVSTSWQPCSRWEVFKHVVKVAVWVQHVFLNWWSFGYRGWPKIVKGQDEKQCQHFLVAFLLSCASWTDCTVYATSLQLLCAVMTWQMYGLLHFFYVKSYTYKTVLTTCDRIAEIP